MSVCANSSGDEAERQKAVGSHGQGLDVQMRMWNIVMITLQVGQEMHSSAVCPTDRFEP